MYILRPASAPPSYLALACSHNHRATAGRPRIGTNHEGLGRQGLPMHDSAASCSRRSRMSKTAGTPLSINGSTAAPDRRDPRRACARHARPRPVVSCLRWSTRSSSPDGRAGKAGAKCGCVTAAARVALSWRQLTASRVGEGTYYASEWPRISMMLLCIAVTSKVVARSLSPTRRHLEDRLQRQSTRSTAASGAAMNGCALRALSRWRRTCV